MVYTKIRKESGLLIRFAKYPIMFKNYLKIAWRHLLRDTTTSGINILGLALAIAVTMLIGLYIRHEINYDNWFETDDEIYRVYRHWNNEGQRWVWTPGALSEKLVADFPEVGAATHIGPRYEILLGVDDKKIYVEESVFVDSMFFKTIPFAFQSGNPITALDAPNAIVLTEKVAKQFFGERNPIGETMLLNGSENRIVTGVLATHGNTHLERKVYLRQNFPNWGWLNNSTATYIRLRANTNLVDLAGKVKKEVNPRFAQAFKDSGQEYSEDKLSDWDFQAIADVHLKSQEYVWEEEANGDIRYLYLLGLIAAILLLIAIFNYANLSLAQSSMRTKEIGVRKVTGAMPSQVMRQFLVESLLQSFLAVGLGGGLTYLCLPVFQQLTGVTFHIDWREIIAYLPIIIAGGVGIGLLAGIYPSFVLARLKPSRVFAHQTNSTTKFGLRQMLVVAQFVVVITMLTVLAFISQQVDYMLYQDLGFKGDQVITIPMDQNYSKARINSMTPRILSIPGVEAFGVSSHVPGEQPYNWSAHLGGQEGPIGTNLIFANEGILDTWDVAMKEGRNFTRPSDSLNFIVNEAFVKKYKLKDPLNTPVRLFADSIDRSIVGVVKDFHQNSLDHAIEPLLISGSTSWEPKASLKISGNNISATIQQLETLWQTLEPERPMRYTFLDASFASQYAMQLRFRKGLSYATALTVLIAILGLFGLASFAIQRRRKEIGIRKVLGASVLQVVGNLNRSFLQLVILALLIAIPLARYITNYWLADYPYRIELNWWVFALTGLLAIGIAFITVSLQSVRAAMTNPVNALKND